MSAVPAVTVAIPAFDAAPFIEHCVRSALDSSLAEIEVLVLDDASNDGTADIAASIRDSRVQVVRQEENTGRAANVKRALEAGSADVVALLPADCALGPDSLRTRFEALAQCPGSTFSFGVAELCDERDRPIGARSFGPRPRVLHGLEVPGPFLPSNRVFLSTCLVRRSAYQRVGGLRFDVAPTHRDWDLLLRLAMVGPVVYTPTIAAVERVHDGNVTATLQREDRIVTAELLVLDAARTWATVFVPSEAEQMERAVKQWARRRIAHALLAIAGYTSSDPARALGCALALDPALRHSPAYHAALLTSALPEAVVRPVLRPLLAPFDRRRRRRWNL